MAIVITPDVTTRLGKIWTLNDILYELQSITGQVDEEAVPKKSINRHIDIATQEVVTLLNNLCAPWYGFRTVVSGITTGENKIDMATTNPIYVDTNKTVAPSKIIAVINSETGSCRRAKDWNQYAGLKMGGNIQFSESYVWLQHGWVVYLWVGADCTPDNAEIIGYRQAAPMVTGTDFSGNETSGTIKIDLPDKYVPLVVSKTALWIMKQAKMGNWEEQAENVNAGIMQLQKEYEGDLQQNILRSRNESVEGI